MLREKIVSDKCDMYSAADAMVVVRFRKLDGINIEGIISNIHIPDEISFSNYGDMLLKIEQIYDLLGMRTDSNKLRGNVTAQKWQKSVLKSAEDRKRGVDVWQYSHDLQVSGDPVIYIHTLYWQNYSWQGFILARKYKDRIYYRSALELLHIIDGLIRGKQDFDCGG